jgi:CHASE2 domain-containing sensor protein
VNQLVILKFGEGSFSQGFRVTLQLGPDGDRPVLERVGHLPSAPEIPGYYHRWQTLYRLLGVPFRLEAPEQQITQLSQSDFQQATHTLCQAFNTWLQAESFRPLREKWLEQLVPTDTIRVILQTEHQQLQRLPWHQWDLLERYPNAEIAFSTPMYEREVRSSPPRTFVAGQVQILAILGNSTGIDVRADQVWLESLPHATVKFLVEPQRGQLSDQLWEHPWDLLFFAGHSATQPQGNTGRIFINSADSLTIGELKYAVRKAVASGLKLAIFNSCDGLGLAQELSDLHIPQIIVMREPIPDQVAQAFLRYFLAAFTQGRSLYLAVREARERLQALELQFPCATWLPVIYQNPAEIPLTWQDWQDQHTQPDRPLSTVNWRRLSTVMATGVAIASLVWGTRWLGLLQPLELGAFDHLLRLRPAEVPDPRLVVIAVTEADLKVQGQEPRQGSLSDRTLKTLLAKLESYQPRVIGLDIYRDFPTSAQHPELVRQLAHNPRLIAICKSRDPGLDPAGVAPPPEVEPAQLGFSDFVEDADGILRRQLLFLTPDPISPCATPYAFSTQVAFRYLQALGITPRFTPEGNLQLGSRVFARLHPGAGGYQRLDAGGNQILINYRPVRSGQKLVTQVTLSDLVNGAVSPNAIRDKVILIGVTAPSAGDYWATPYGAGPTHKLPGVVVQAQMVSQILSAVVDRRPLIWVWHPGGEVLWIGGWAIGGGLLVGCIRRLTHLGLAGGVSLGILYGLCWLLLTQGGWVPLIPPMLTFVSTGSAVLYLRSRSGWELDKQDADRTTNAVGSWNGQLARRCETGGH